MGVDLNLYLGLRRSPGVSNLAALGFDLALGSSSTGPLGMSGAAGPSDSIPRYSPAHPSYNPSLPSITPRRHSPELFQYYLNESLGPFVPPAEQEPEGQGTSYSPSDARVLPLEQEVDEPMLPPIEFAERLASQSYIPPMLPYRPVFASFYRSGARGPFDPPAVQDAPYSPSDVQVFPLVEEADEGIGSPLELANVPSSPSLIRRLPSPSLGDVGLSGFRPVSLQDGEDSDQDGDGWSYSPHSHIGSPDFGLSPPRYGTERSSLDRPSSPVPELLRDILRSQRELGCRREDKGSTKHATAEDSEEEAEEESGNSANFECSICFEMAKEPVVTSCGHLFCWPCLYQWLHLHCDQKECPVCKGEIIESNITPIYGRGSSGSKLGENKELGLKIPPRPRGNRVESSRQDFRSISARLPAPIFWRHADNHIFNRNRFDGHEEPSLQGIPEGGDDHRSPPTRMRARRRQREEGNSEHGPSERGIRLIRDSTPELSFLDGVRVEDFNWSGRGISNSSTRHVASTSSVNPRNVEHLTIEYAPVRLAADQASASSTMAVIQGDGVVTDVLAEPNSAGSSRSNRRRGRNNLPRYWDVDAGVSHPHSRRRLS